MPTVTNQASTISALIIDFPRHYEVKMLIAENNLVIEEFSNEILVEIEHAISAIRKAHGLFNTSHFKPILEFLEHDWLPEDIPMLLPQP